VLDIADKCPDVPETYNGFEDEDGCPDTVPPDVDALRGTIEGLIYAEGETAVRDSALPSIRKIARTMKAHPTIRVVGNPCIPRASACLPSASTSMCTCVRWRLRCTIRIRSRTAATTVASRSA
jgi:hypothetical protein